MLSDHGGAPNRPSGFHVKVDSAGRILLPKPIRDDLHLMAGDTVALAVHHGCVVLKSLAQALADARAFFADVAPPDVILSDELIADRRAEAEND